MDCNKLQKSQEEADYNEIEYFLDQDSGRFKYGQYNRCTSLSYIYPESDWNSLKDLSGIYNYGTGQSFRELQYASIGQAIAPDEGAMPLITETARSFRYRQYYNSKIIEIGKEADMVNLVSSQRDFRYGQYESCPNITNNKRLSEGLTALNVSSFAQNYRKGQFLNSSIVYALKERDINIEHFSDSMRKEMYKNCTSLVEVYEEKNDYSGSASGVMNYKISQYENCINLAPTNENVIKKFDGVTSYSSQFRSKQFAGTPFKNTSGNRINYIDGSEVIEGQDGIPADFYTD